MKYSIVMTIRYNSQCLAKTREERNAFNEKYIIPIIEKYSKYVKVRFFDAECFYARGSDFFIFECNDLKKYYFMFKICEIQSYLKINNSCCMIYFSFRKIFRNRYYFKFYFLQYEFTLNGVIGE